jgi:CheY-like chemotaxis protein
MALKVMVVDDELGILKLFKALVEPMGFEVHTMADSGQAAERLNKEKFDGLFFDANMPFPNGFELTQLVRASPSNSKVPIVMLTGMDDVGTMRKGFQAGITFFLGKPISKDRVASIVNVMRGVMLNEKRRHARLPLRTTVTCQLKEASFKSQSVNIGSGGMLLETSAETSLGQEFDLKFTIPECPRVLGPHARIVRKQPPNRIAVRFLTMEREDQEAIEGYISGKITG